MPRLSLCDFSKVFQLECDSSGSDIGAILIQEGTSLSFFSDKLSYAKRKCLVYDQELYAIIQDLMK